MKTKLFGTIAASEQEPSVGGGEKDVLMDFSTRGTLAALALFGLATLPQAAQAQTTALSFSGGTPMTANSTVVGWRFTLASPIVVTSLGFFDSGDDGLSFAHQVGIYNTGSQALLVSATVASGTTDPLETSFRYNSTLSGSTSLPAGDYVIAAQGVDGGTGQDQIRGVVAAGSMSTAGELTYVENRVRTSTTGLAFPNLPFAPQERGYFGPNFKFTSASSAAPEPGTLALLALGIVGGVVARRRK